jgi:hypothetical protein
MAGGHMRDRNENSEAQANKWARRAAAAVLAIGAALIVAPALISLGEVWENPFEPESSVTTVVTEKPDGSTETRTTTSEASRSFVERSLAAGGLLLLRIGIVALAAFLAGAVVQRTILGDFAMKFGPVEVPALAQTAAASEKAIEEIKQELGRQADATRRAMGVAADNAIELALIKENLQELGVESEGTEQGGEQTSGLETTGDEEGGLHLEPEQEGEADE